MPDNRYKDGICLLGGPLGTGNRGVSALGASLYHLVQELAPESRAVMLVSDRGEKRYEVIAKGKRVEVPMLRHRLSPKAPLSEQLAWILFLAVLYRIIPWAAFRRKIAHSNAWIAAVVNARLVGEICGGDSFSDIYGFRRFFFRILPTLIVILLRGEVVLFPQTYGPFKSRIATRFASVVIRKASAILARDQVGYDEALKLGADPKRLVLCPDVAFTLPVEKIPNPDIQPPISERKKKCLIGINVSGLMYRGGYSRSNMFGLKLDYPRFLKNLIPELLKANENEIVLIPHTMAAPDRVESDNGASEELWQALPPALRSRVHLVKGQYDQHQIKAIISSCDFFIGSRMHACIAALSQRIPAVGVAYSRKFLGVFGLVGVEEYVVDGCSVEAEEAIRRVLERFATRETARRKLVENMETTKSEIYRNFSLLLHRHDAPNASSHGDILLRKPHLQKIRSDKNASVSLERKPAGR